MDEHASEQAAEAHNTHEAQMGQCKAAGKTTGVDLCGQWDGMQIECGSLRVRGMWADLTCFRGGGSCPRTAF